MSESFEEDLIIADSLKGLTPRQRRLLVMSDTKNLSNKQKYRQMLINGVGEGVYNKCWENYCDQKYRDEVLDNLKQKQVTCITAQNKYYPHELICAASPPSVLYCRGNIELLKDKKLAIVGSRRTMPQMLETCKSMAAQLTQGLTIVTGTTAGAETAAALGALDSGKIICVIPHGFKYVCPVGSVDIFRKVQDKGLLVSEYQPDVPPTKYMYSLRNRLIAGISHGTLLVSASMKSGALTTVDYAREYGRELFAFPYSIGLTSGEGCNSLIKKGAHLVDNVLDIFNVFGLECKKEEAVELTDEERDVITVLKDEGETHVEVLAKKLNKKPFQLAAVLSSLEIKGQITRTPANHVVSVW